MVPAVSVMDQTIEQQVTPTLELARKRRMMLHGALVEAETKLSSPAPGRIDVWCREMCDSLHRLRDAFDEHVFGTEQTQGLYDEILERAPRLSNKVQRLRDEHAVIRASLDGLIDTLGAGEPETEEEVVEARDAVQQVLGMVIRHRQLGADLVWDAYNLDIGSPG